MGGWVGWVLCWDSVGRAVDIPTQRYSTYPHTKSLYNTMSSPPTNDRIRIRTARHTPFSPPSPNSHPPYPPYLPTLPRSHPTLLPRQLYSNNSTRPSTISTAPRSLSHPRHTLTPPNQTHSHTSNQPIYPTIHTPHIIVPSKPSPLLPLYAHSAAKTRIIPSKAHMSLGRFYCVLTIEYKSKTSNI